MRITVRLHANTQQGYTESFIDVDVSACVGVRGRLQMLQGAFFNTREVNGKHMNAYIKTSGEQTLTHWEPRNGPQRFFNDTLCAMVTSTVTSLFEKGIRENTIESSKQAAKEILKNKRLVDIFDEVLELAKDKILHIITSIRVLTP